MGDRISAGCAVGPGRSRWRGGEDDGFEGNGLAGGVWGGPLLILTPGTGPRGAARMVSASPGHGTLSAWASEEAGPHLAWRRGWGGPGRRHSGVWR